MGGKTIAGFDAALWFESVANLEAVVAAGGGHVEVLGEECAVHLHRPLAGVDAYGKWHLLAPWCLVSVDADVYDSRGTAERLLAKVTWQ